ncbi:hypothetical protein LguiB_027855 [Lonicera macranthoides]
MGKSVSEGGYSGTIKSPGAKKKLVKKVNPDDMIRLYPTPESTLCEFCMRKATCRTVRLKTSLMMTLIRKKNPKEAQSVFDNLIEGGHRPSLVTYTVLIKALIDLKCFNLIHLIISQVKANGMKPDLLFYHAVMKAYFESGNADEAMKTFWEMKESGIEPNTATFNLLSFWYMNKGKYKESLNLLELMSTEEHVEPDLRTCNLLVRALCHMNNITEACNVVEKIVISGLKPDAFNYNTIAAAYGKNGDAKSGEELVFEMRDNNVEIYQMTCRSIISGYCKEGKMKDALSFVYKMKDLRVQPNIIIFNSLINRLVDVNDSDGIDEVLTLMEEYGIEPDVITFSTIMNSWSNVGDMDKCRAIFDDMVNTGIEPDYHAYCILAKVYVRAGKPDKAQELLGPMIKLGFQLKDQVFFTTLITGWCLSGRVDNAFYVFNQMCQYRVRPRLQNFENLIWGFGEAQQPWRAEEMLKLMRKYKVHPERRTYALIEEAKAKFDDTKKSGRGPGLVRPNDNEKQEVEFVYKNLLRKENVSSGTSKRNRVVVREAEFSSKSLWGDTKNVQRSCTFGAVVRRKQIFMHGQIALLSMAAF